MRGDRFFSGGYSRNFLVLTMVAVVAACAPKSYIVLLENADGTTGKVVVTAKQSTTVVDQARQGAALDGSTTKTFVVDADQLRKDFGAAMAAQPVPPKIFLLYFEAGGVNLTAESAALIPEVLAELKRRPAPDVSVIGHTDTVGDADKNEALALKRAEQVRQLLVGPEVTVKDVEVTSHGERNLLVPTPDNTPEPRNRRVEITVR